MHNRMDRSKSMPIFQNLKQYVHSENANDRYSAIENLVKNSQSWQENLLIWQIMTLYPTHEEKSKLAKSLILPNHPSSEWAIISYLLLKEIDENVISSCLDAITNSQRLSFSRYISNLIKNPNLSYKILYSIFKYIEKTGDENISNNLEHYFHNNLPDNILSKGFNVFIKLGIINKKVKEIAFQILERYDFDDLKNSSTISALLYLGFACNTDEIEKLQHLKKTIKNSEIFRILENMLTQIYELKKFNFNEKSAEYLIKKSYFEEKPNFFGYGTISQKYLEIATKNLIIKSNNKNNYELTCTILKLKNRKCIDILAKNKYFGISNIEKNKNNILAKAWTNCIPYFDQTFLNSVQNPENYNIWHENNQNLSYIFLDSEILFKSNENSWQLFYEKTFNTQIILNQILTLGSLSESNINQNIIIKYENIIIENIKKYISSIHFMNEKKSEIFIEKIYAAIIGHHCSANLIRETYKTIPFLNTSWVFTAIALYAPRIDIHTISLAIQNELETIKKTLINGNMEKNEYILEVTSKFQSILVGAERFHIPILQPTLSTLRDISILIQHSLDSSTLTEEESDIENFDWNGNKLIDRPILRWGAILQICLNTHITLEEKDYYEKIIREGLRVAPHVEKRWIVKALVKLDTEDAIKAILYQALQHIDIDFVEYTINELLNSKQPRSQQALIRTISKNIISNKLKIKIINQISQINSEEILQELKNLLLLRLPEDIDNALQVAINKISNSITLPVKNENIKEFSISSQNIDLIIKSLVPWSDALSIDSKSALRTAEMILIQSKEWGNEAVDLSPIVNMHCKAVELTMRDTFEAYTDSIIRKGELSQKLDTLGYGKGIVEKMTIFEDYIANLPSIKTIPYFSKFKLRKMLRAICHFRIGKRFTLDGPKAFALFLLVTARKECLFNLNKILDINFKNDLELFEFIKLVHSLQDSRNRAVHEGLTWEARDEIDSMKKQAYKILQTCLTIERSFETQGNTKKDSYIMESF